MSVPDAVPEGYFVDTNIWLYAFIEEKIARKSLVPKSF
jgi:hypothetical protein